MRKQEPKRYSEKFKARMVERMTGPRRVSANALSKEVGVGQPTLSLWLRRAGRVTAVNNDDDVCCSACTMDEEEQHVEWWSRRGDG